MAGECFDAARALVEIMIELGGLFYTKPCFLEKQIHIQVNLLEAFTKRKLWRVQHELDKLATRLECEFVYSNLESGFLVYTVSERAREFELGLGEILLGLPEYKATISSCLSPLGLSHEPLRVPDRVDVPRYLQMDSVDAFWCPIDMMIRVSDYLWAKKTPLPANFRREVEESLFSDYRPLVTRVEALILRAVDFHREGYAILPSFLGRTESGDLAWES